jgi:hypothetical protein
MAAFLFVTASMALLGGLVGLIAGHMPRRTGRPQAPPTFVLAREQGTTAGDHARIDGRLMGRGQAL